VQITNIIFVSTRCAVMHDGRRPFTSSWPHDFFFVACAINYGLQSYKSVAVLGSTMSLSFYCASHVQYVRSAVLLWECHLSIRR